MQRSLANGEYKLPVIHTKATFPFKQTVVDQLAASSLKNHPLYSNIQNVTPRVKDVLLRKNKGQNSSMFL